MWLGKSVNVSNEVDIALQMLAESCASVSVILKLNKEFIFQLPARVILISWNKQIHKSLDPN